MNADDAPRLTTVGVGGATAYVVDLTNASAPVSQRSLRIPTAAGDTDFSAVWHFAVSGDVTYTLSYRNTRFKFVSYKGAARADAGGASASAVTLESSAAVLGSGGAILAADAGFPTGPAVNMVRVGDYRWIAVFGSGPAGGKVISVVELEGSASGTGLAVRTAAVKAGVALSEKTGGLIGVGHATRAGGGEAIVTGGKDRTYVFPYTNPTASPSSLSAPLELANPVGYEFLQAAGAEAGAAWWVGIRSDSSGFGVFKVDLATGAILTTGPAKAIEAGGRVVATFDPYDGSRLLAVVSRSGAARVYRFGLPADAAGIDTALDFSSGLNPPPVALAPSGLGGLGYLSGRATESADGLYVIGVDGKLTRSSLAFGAERHQTLLLDVPQAANLELSASGDGTVTGGDTVTYTVKRTVNSATSLAATYSIAAKGGDPVAAGVDYDGPSTGSVALAAGETTKSFTVRTLPVTCKDARTFVVTLSSPDAIVTNPAGVERTIARSTSCSYTVAAPTLAPGQSGTATVTRTGNTTGPFGGVAYTVEAEAGVLSSPAGGTLSFSAGQGQATIPVTATRFNGTCRVAKSFKVKVDTAEATGAVTAVSAGCGATASVTSPPSEPYLPGDVLTVSLTEVTPGALDLAKASWSVQGDSSERDVIVQDGPQVQVRWKVPTGGRTVTYVVPYPAGSSTPPFTGELTLRVASYADLIRLDGPTQVLTQGDRKRRFSILWQGSARGGTWSDGKTLVWKKGGDEIASCRGSQECFLDGGPNSTSVSVEANFTGGSQPIHAMSVTVVPPPLDTKSGQTVRYVPIAVQSPGANNAVFETEITLINRDTTTAEVELDFAGFRQTEWVGAGRQLVINGLVERLKETKSDVPDAVVAPLKVTFRKVDPAADVDVIARTTTPAGDDQVIAKRGRAGLAYRGLRDTELFGDPGPSIGFRSPSGASQARSGKAILIGLRGTAREMGTSSDRTNVAIVNPGTGPVVTELKQFREDGQLLSTDTVTVQAGGFEQVTTLPVAGSEVAYATVEWKSGGVFTTYATPLNNRSNDGSFVFPQRADDPVVDDTLVLPVLLELPRTGSTTSFSFLSDLGVTAPPPGLTYRLSFFPNTGGVSTLTRALSGQQVLGKPAGPGLQPKGIVQELRDAGASLPAVNSLILGLALVGRADGGAFKLGDFLAGTRVDGPAAGDADGSLFGRFGVFVPALPISSLRNLAEIGILGLRQDEEVRSNLAMFNPGDRAVGLKIELYDSDNPGAALASDFAGCTVSAGRLTLEARQFCQITAILDQAGVRSGYVRITRTGSDPSQPYGAYGVINDGSDSSRGTSDGAFLPAFLKTCADLGIAIAPPAGNLPAKRNAAFSQTFLASPAGRDYTYTYQASPAVPGVAFSGGTLSGTPTQTGSFPFRVTATDPVGCAATQEYALVVDDCTGLTLSQTGVVSVGAAAGSNSFSVQTTCDFTVATGDPSWLTVNPTSGKGATEVTYAFAQNTAPSGRSAAVTVTGGGQTASFTVGQAAAGATPCSFTLDPSGPLDLDAQSHPGNTFKVTPAPATCRWTVAKDGSTWITGLAPAGETTGVGNVTFDVSPNPTAAREGVFTITAVNGFAGARTFTVRQAGPVAACSYTLNPTNGSFDFNAQADKTFSVTASRQDCAWTASSDQAWVTTASGGTGNGSVMYSVAANGVSTSRSATITVSGGGGSAPFAVNQAAPGAGTYDLNPTGATLDTSAHGGQSSFTVTPSRQESARTATSDRPWATTTSTGTGNGSVSHGVAANSPPGRGEPQGGRRRRSGVHSDLGRWLHVLLEPGRSERTGLRREGPDLPGPDRGRPPVDGRRQTPREQRDRRRGRGGGGDLPRPPEPGSGALRDHYGRVQTFTVSQASGCSFALNPTGSDQPAAGATGQTFQVLTAAGCAWTATSNDGWVTVTAGGAGREPAP